MSFRLVKTAIRRNRRVEITERRNMQLRMIKIAERRNREVDITERRNMLLKLIKMIKDGTDGAKELVAQDSLSFSPKLGLFTIFVRITTHTVKLYPNEGCSCPISKNCLHILAVKIGLRMQIEECRAVNNVGVMRKNFRVLKQKPGRKRPRPGNMDTVETVQIEQKRKYTKEPEDTEQPEQISKSIRPTEQLELNIKQTEQQMEQLDAQGTEQMEQNIKQTEQQMEQLDAQETEQMEHNIKQTEQHMEHLDALERTMDLLLSQQHDGSQSNDETLARALKELEESVVELIDDFKSQLKKTKETGFPDISFENMITSTPKSDIQKDILYSLEVWVPADKERLFYNLNIQERKILQSKNA